MNKQILLLSVAVAALAASPAFADPSPDWTDITTAITVPVDTAHATPGDPDGTQGDILLDTGGTITVAIDGAAVTINSDDSFKAVAGTQIINKNTTGAIGILVDLTTTSRDSTTCFSSDPCFTGITEQGQIDMTGTGDTKKGIWLQGPDSDSGLGPFAFVGNVDLTDSVITITGDSSVGIQIDQLADLDGNLIIGTMNLKPTSSSSTLGVIGLQLDGVVNGDVDESASMTLIGGTSSTASALIGMNITGTGTINGNLTIDDSSGVHAVGQGAHAILLLGNLQACDINVTPTCNVASDGSFINNGSITTAGQQAALTAKTGNPVASSAISIGGNIAGGFYNAGASFAGDTTAEASISAQAVAPAINITPALQNTTTPSSIVIGVYELNGIEDPTDPGFSLYNRGVITAASANLNENAQAIFIGSGTPDATATLTGGLFNAGTIQAIAGNQAGGIAVTAIALNIGDYAHIGIDPNDITQGDFYTIDTSDNGTYTYTYHGSKGFTDDLHDERAAIVNSAEAGSGTIVASVSGTLGGEADAIIISANAIVPSIINTGKIQAIATTTDAANTTALTARAIVDRSGTLTFIENNGLIAAATTTLDNDAQVATAIDLSADNESTAAGNGVLILNRATANGSATITGDIKFGTGDKQIVDVEGASTTNVATINGDIFFGGGSTAGSDQLIIGNFATVTGKVTANSIVGVDVNVESGGTFNIMNDTTALDAYDFRIQPGGILNLTLLEEFRTGIVDAIHSATFDSGALLNIKYGSFIPSDSKFILISAPHGALTVSDKDLYNTEINDELPFLFDHANLFIDDTTDPVNDLLTLEVFPKDASQLGLSGYAAQMLPFANQALSNDDTLGAAFVSGVTSQKAAQLAYNEMAPDVSGGARAIAIALTDQSSGPVAARQRILRMYGKQSGEVTLWGEEYAEFVSDPGEKSTGQTGFKDHGFGFVLGLDGGDPKTGWYGGAFSFYSGDIVEPLPRNSHTNTLWYMLTGYTDWRGRGLFLDTKADIGYLDLKSKRFLDLTIPNASGTGSTSFVDEADGKRPGLVGALGLTTGAILAYGSTTFTPQLSIDGMTMREEGYTETHVGGTAAGNGKGMDLQTQSYYASSLRVFLGTEIREDLDFGDFFVQPDIRLGYRYDFLNDPTKLKVNFADIGTNSTPTAGPVFTVVGPDPAQGNFVAGASLSTTTDAWTLGANFDFVRGTNGATTEVGTIHLLGRI